MARDIISIARQNSLIDTHGGPAILATAPLGTTFPTGIEDVIDFDQGPTQFAFKEPWSSIGVTRGGITISRGFEEVRRDSDQSYGAFDVRPTGWTTTVATELLKTGPTELQLAWVGGAITEAARVKTSVGVAVAADDSTVTVMDATGLAEDDYVLIGNDVYQEVVKISGIAGNVLTLQDGTQYAHASGTIVLKWVERSMPFGTARTLPPKLLVVVTKPQYDDPSAGGVIDGYRMYAFRRVKLEVGQRQIQHSNAQDWTLPVSFLALPDLDIADPDLDTFQIFEKAYV